MQQNDEMMVKSLAQTVRDESKPAAERHDALKHICRITGDVYQHVPIEQLRLVVAAIMEFPGFRGLSLKDAAEAVASGFAQRTAPTTRR
jgi:hypothetical protein